MQKKSLLLPKQNPRQNSLSLMQKKSLLLPKQNPRQKQKPRQQQNPRQKQKQKPRQTQNQKKSLSLMQKKSPSLMEIRMRFRQFAMPFLLSRVRTSPVPSPALLSPSAPPAPSL